MSSFKLEIITPDREFYNNPVQSVTYNTFGGEIGILSGHQTMVSIIYEGIIKIKADDKWRDAAISDGFVEVRPDETVIFAKYCEWADEIDAVKEAREKEHIEEKLRHEESISKQKHNQISITRTIENTKSKSNKMLE